MFAYASCLVENGLVDEVFLSFLVVGHTHCNLDQEFSVIWNKIQASEFIGTPVGMWELLKIANCTALEKRPLYVEHLEHCHDWKKYFAPILNREIKFYQVLWLSTKIWILI